MRGSTDSKWCLVNSVEIRLSLYHQKLANPLKSMDANIMAMKTGIVCNVFNYSKILLIMLLEYLLPSDRKEQERLSKYLSDSIFTSLSNTIDSQHELFQSTLDERLHLAVLPTTIHRVLDIGTGTGIWAECFGKKIIFFAALY